MSFFIGWVRKFLTHFFWFMSTFNDSFLKWAEELFHLMFRIVFVPFPIEHILRCHHLSEIYQCSPLSSFHDYRRTLSQPSYTDAMWWFFFWFIFSLAWKYEIFHEKPKIINFVDVHIPQAYLLLLLKHRDQNNGLILAHTLSSVTSSTSTIFLGIV